MSPEEAGRDPHAKWFVLGAAALGAFAATVMGTSVNVAIPSLVGAFDTTFAVVQWVVLSYLLATSALLPIIGRLADMLGKKAILLSGFGLYTVGSLLSGLAPDVLTLIGFRTVQGVGSAILAAIGLAIVTDVFPAEERGRAIGINGSVLSTGIVIGPTLGGFLVDALSWRWVFLVGVPVGLIGLAIAWQFVPRYQRGPRQRFDIPGALTLFGTLLTLSLALTLGQGRGFADPVILALFAASAALLAVFVAIERRAEAPVLDLKLFRNIPLVVGLVAGLTTFVSISGVIFLMPFYLETILGYAPRNVGLLMSVVPIVLVVVAPIAGALADRFGERIVTVVGLTIALTGFVAIGSLDQETTALGYILRFLPVGLGMATFQSPNNSAIMGAVARSRSGVAGGLLALTRALGQTTGIAVLGSLWAARIGARSEVPVGAEATTAPLGVQVAALHDVLIVVQILILSGLLLTAWDLWRRRQRAATPAPAE